MGFNRRPGANNNRGRLADLLGVAGGVVPSTDPLAVLMSDGSAVLMSDGSAVQLTV